MRHALPDIVLIALVAAGSSGLAALGYPWAGIAMIAALVTLLALVLAAHKWLQLACSTAE